MQARQKPVYSLFIHTKGAWWRYVMEPLSAVLALYKRFYFSSQRSVVSGFEVLFGVRWYNRQTVDFSVIWDAMMPVYRHFIGPEICLQVMTPYLMILLLDSCDRTSFSFCGHIISSLHIFCHKWKPEKGRHFAHDFFNYIFLDYCVSMQFNWNLCLRVHWWYNSIGLGNSLAKYRGQVLSWTNDDKLRRHFYGTKRRVVTIANLSSLVTQKVAIFTTFGVANDGKVSIYFKYYCR